MESRYLGGRNGWAHARTPEAMLGGSSGRRWHLQGGQPGSWGKRVRRPGLELEGSWPQLLSESPAHRTAPGAPATGPAERDESAEEIRRCGRRRGSHSTLWGTEAGFKGGG